VLDTVWTALQALNLGLAVASDEQEWEDTFSGNPPFSRNVGIGVYSVFAALGAAGMWFGYTRTSACRAAKSDLATRGGGMQPGMPGMQPWPPPPQPGAPAPGTTPPPPPAPAPAPGTPPTLPPPPGPTP
jgi:hypothetical protein